MSKNISEIIERIKQKEKFKTEGEVAFALKIGHAALSNHKSRGSLPTDALFTYSERTGTSLDWLLTGEGEMTRLDVVCDPKAYYGTDPVIQKIVLLLNEMPEDARMDILRNVEEKKLLRELLEERKRKEG